MEAAATRTEVRKYLRVKPDKNVYAVFGTEKNIIAELCDISMGGVACKHVTDSDNSYDYSLVDLFTLDNQFYMSKIPCSFVYSVKMDQNSDIKDKIAVKIRRVGLRFTKLNFLHHIQLKSFVETSTICN